MGDTVLYLQYVRMSPENTFKIKNISHLHNIHSTINILVRFWQYKHVKSQFENILPKLPYMAKKQ